MSTRTPKYLTVIREAVACAVMDLRDGLREGNDDIEVTVASVTDAAYQALDSGYSDGGLAPSTLRRIHAPEALALCEAAARDLIFATDDQIDLICRPTGTEERMRAALPIGPLAPDCKRASGCRCPVLPGEAEALAAKQKVEAHELAARTYRANREAAVTLGMDKKTFDTKCAGLVTARGEGSNPYAWSDASATVLIDLQLGPAAGQARINGPKVTPSTLTH